MTATALEPARRGPAPPPDPAGRGDHDHVECRRGRCCADRRTVGFLGALIGFGLDSVVEVLSAAAVAWQFASPDPEKRERAALLVISVAFFALAVYVTVDSVLALTGLREPERCSTVGIVLGILQSRGDAGPELVRAPHRPRARLRLRSRGLQADADLRLPVGRPRGRIGLNALFGWAWADSVATLFIAGFAVREGVEAWRGRACCAAPVSVLTGEVEACDDGCC